MKRVLAIVILSGTVLAALVEAGRYAGWRGFETLAGILLASAVLTWAINVVCEPRKKP